MAVTAAESVDRLRQWALGRCLSANAPGIYSRTAGGAATRRVMRNAAAN